MSTIPYVGGMPATEIVSSGPWYSGVNNPGPTSITITNVPLGPAAADRHVFFVLAGLVGGGLTSATIGGVAATLHVNRQPFGGVITYWHTIASALLPSGSSTTISLAFPTTGLKNFTLWPFSVYKLRSITPFNINGQDDISTTTTLNSSINTARGGLIIGGGICSTSSAPITSSTVANVNEYQHDADHDFAFWGADVASGTPLPMTFTRGGTTGAYYSASLLSFR